MTRVNPGNRFVQFSIEETEQSIVERFEKQVRKNPHSIAVQTRHVQLTYDDLNRSANRLAWVLLEQCRDDGPVAILMEHDASAVIAIVGALKASKIFIPLDPALPDARIEQILNDSGSNLIVTNDQSLGTALDLLEGARPIVNFDHVGAYANADNVDLKITPDRIGYILYTSGSTGRPKGVIRTHRNDLHNVRNHTNGLCLSDDDRITLLGSYSTGQGMQNIYCTLLNGATLFPRNLKTEGFHGLADWLMQERITVYHSAATFFRHFVRTLSGREIFPELRIVRLCSEPVSWKDVESYKKHFSENCVLVNELSCSEAKTFSRFLVTKQTEINVTVPVGYPVEDKEILILDEKGDPSGPGDVGEIAVRSRFLSPGYWKRPDLTALAFIPDRESDAHRIYRTGDLGRMSADGCLEHLGRKDAQVKIRGYRVECYEIELALLQNPAVAQTFVTNLQNARGETYLVAYIVCEKGAVLTVSELRVGLVARLPEYMVPTDFVFVDTLPLTPTGKIDRSELPEPRTARPPLDVPFVAPRSPLEESVTDLCSQILGVSMIGVDDNLFDLGGNSLSAMQVVALVMKMFSVNVPLKRFYESPTVASLSEIIEAVHGTGRATENSGISAAPRDGHPPLSYFQERLWFMEQWEPGKATYNLSQAYRIGGRLDARAMEESLNVVIERHEVLRSSFGSDEGRPSQIIAPIVRLPFSILDLRTEPEVERNETSLQLVHEDARRPFDLAQGPLLRALLVQLGDEEHIFVLTVHQIVCDGWSVRILLSEFWQAYGAISHSRSLSLPTLPVQYADFAIWQRQFLSEEWIESQLSFWKQTLGGTLPVLALPTDNPRPVLQSFRGSRIFFGLPESLTEALNKLSRQEGVTLFMTLMTAFKILLYRYTGQEDLVVGFPIADRHGGEATGSVGFFVNTLVARTNPSGELTYRELLFRVRDICLNAYAHQDVPFEKLVEVLRPIRDLSRNPVFQVMFTFQNMPFTYPVPPALWSTPIRVDNGTSKVDLTLSLAERDSQLTGFFEYCTDLFDHTTIERMADHFRMLLERVVADRTERIAKLSFLTERERYQLLVEWNDTAADYPRGSCIHELFEAQVERTPEAIAVQFEGRQLTYRELNSRANQLAHYLQDLGVGLEQLVGICVERSLEMMIGLLGILKAGGAYVPLDPAYPRERLAFMLKDAQVSVLLIQEGLIEDRISKTEDSDSQSSILDPQIRVVCLDTCWETIAQESRQNLCSEATIDNSAYVIYTSGSTGIPKGVVGLHRGAVNRFTWMWRNHPFRQNETGCLKTSLSFVDSVWEVFGPLLQGISSIIIPDHIVKDPELLIPALAVNHVTRIGLVPSLLESLLDVYPVLQDHLPELKLWCCSGESLPKEVVERFRKSMPGATLLNLYGSTEVSADVTCYDTRMGNLKHVIPIGRPLSNTQSYILDSNLQLVPIGVPGDLYVGGDGMARGYLNRPELTAEKFIPNPFDGEPGARLYRTGDLCRYLSDGNIEFLGRVDHQVKIRGYRIELGEIEAVLNQHPGVKETVVVFRERDSSGDKELLAYFVPRQDSDPSVIDLRGFLREKVPEYMIPARFVAIDALPVTPNGKVDRSQLPPPDGARPKLTQPFVEPRSDIEELVAQVWREVLKLEKIGVYDNFFDLGGHSLLATRVASRLRRNFDVDFPLRKLFELPTVAALGEHIAVLLQDQGGTKTPPIVSVSRDRPLPLSFSQQRLWFLHQLNPDLTAYNIPAVFHIEGDLKISALEEALNAIIARHEILRTNFAIIEGTPVQSILPSMELKLSIEDPGDLPGEVSARALSFEEARRPFNLRDDPLVRTRILRLSDRNYFLLLNIHHAILDGWSMSILFRELGDLYEVFSEGKESLLTPLPLQFADYAVWQRDWMQGEVLESHLAYWKQHLGGQLPALNLPADGERPVTQSFRGRRQASLFSMELTGALKELSRREGVTVFMTLLAAFNILLSREAGQTDVVVGSTIAGRNRPEIEGLIGFFVNVLVLRTDLWGNPSFSELLKRVREVCLGAYTHQDLPFEKIVEEINPDRDLSRNPLFQVLFNVADISERVLQLRGCEVTRTSFFDPPAKFDLTLYAPEKDGRIEFAVVYNTDLFSDNRITTMLEQFQWLLSQIAENPAQTIEHYSLLAPSSKIALPDPTEKLDDRWQGAIQALFTGQAERVPDRLAVYDSNGNWTYKELDAYSNQLAHCLLASGIEPKDLVAIYAHRSSSLALVLLGVLKAGAAFVIFDPTYPSARLADYVRIAQPRGWLQMETAGALPETLRNCLDNLRLRCRISLPSEKDNIGDLLARYPAIETGIVVHADDTAYVAFTSGSTGRPKAVLGRHGPITHFLPWQEEAFKLRESDRFSLLSGLAYNHLHRDVFTPLALGATLYVPPAEIVREPEQLIDWLRTNAISVLHLTPALGQLLSSGGTQPLITVRRVFFGGDVLTTGALAQIRAVVPNARIGSFYGATETQRAVGYYEIPDDYVTNSGDANRPIPLGRGIKDVQLLLLNSSGQLAGIGELGEVYVRSPHLAEGYIGDEELTVERFVTNPFTNDAKDRMYKTGELGRYLPDGNVEWAGRKDRRVNIRGFRVELAEIESVLSRQPAVKDAAVIAKDFLLEGSTHDVRLVAYVVPQLDQPLSIDGLRFFLSARLPDYMVPSHFLILGRLPLTPSGKVDYDALPLWEQSPTGKRDSFVAPRNDVEVKLCEIISQVLGIDQVGVNDNFFRLGGHSLLAAQAAARIRETLGIGLELRTFLESPTVAALANEIEDRLKPVDTTHIGEDTDREEIEL